MYDSTAFPIIQINYKKQKELYSKSYEVTDDDRNRDSESREIYLAKNVGITDKGIGCIIQAVCKISPGNNTGKVEKKRWEPICWKLGYIAKDYSEYHGGEERLYYVPERPKDGLLVNGDKVAPYKETNQVAIFPQFAGMDVEPAGTRANYFIPLLFKSIVHLSAHGFFLSQTS